ncbi:hypothetical protein HDU67_002589 [Dinochytrium kinnereticum]|nr:hypothetical protein HDU67_002589 [Dinochytrium kinnereticum]
MTEAEALAVAKSKQGASVIRGTPEFKKVKAGGGVMVEYTVGDEVSVSPDDYGKVPVRGLIVGVDEVKIVVRLRLVG